MNRTASSCVSATNSEMAKAFFLAGRARRSHLKIRAAFERIAYVFGGRWMGLDRRTPILRNVARFLAADERDYVLARAKSLCVRYQHYDWALNV